ncbi:MAG: hypothetical protein Fur002_04160 [Anaerolineales bacterium]
MTEKFCINCNRTEQEYPLLTLTFQGKDFYICPQCLPNLIHKPQTLVGKIPNFAPPANQPPHEH